MNRKSAPPERRNHSYAETASEVTEKILHQTQDKNMEVEKPRIEASFQLENRVSLNKKLKILCL